MIDRLYKKTLVFRATLDIPHSRKAVSEFLVVNTLHTKIENSTYSSVGLRGDIDSSQFIFILRKEIFIVADERFNGKRPQGKQTTYVKVHFSSAGS